MDEIFDQIQGTLDAGFPYVAIMMALTLPDICASLALPKEAKEKNGFTRRYVQWFDRYASERIPFLTGSDCHSLRCGVIHNGVMGSKDRKFERVVFTIGERHGAMLADDNEVRRVINGPKLDKTHFGRILSFSSVVFVEKMIESAREWYDAKKDDPEVKRNASNLVKYHRNGIAPFTGGHPCIA